jgi:hypothetical protein
MRGWPWQRIAIWIFAITIVMQLWGISDKLDAIHKTSQYIESHTNQAASRLGDTLNVNVENTSLDVVVQ